MYTETIYPKNKLTQIYPINQLTKHNYFSAGGSSPHSVPPGPVTALGLWLEELGTYFEIHLLVITAIHMYTV